MKKIMFGAIVASMLSGSALAADLELKCYDNKEFMKIIDDLDLVTVYNGHIGENKISEILMTKDRRLATVEYEKASDGNAYAAKQYCINGILKDVTFNDSVIEFLFNVLEKMRGQKT